MRPFATKLTKARLNIMSKIIARFETVERKAIVKETGFFQFQIEYHSAKDLRRYGYTNKLNDNTRDYDVAIQYAIEYITKGI